MILWREIQKENFTRWDRLAAFLEMDAENDRHVLSHSRFPLNVPRRLAEKMEKNNLHDPLFRQFVPLQDETQTVAGFCLDAVGDMNAQKTAKLLHKYEGRALIVCTSSCAMHCRFCFRQNFPYEVKRKLFNDELEAIAHDSSLEEIILSGGDPLSLSDLTLEDLICDLSSIPHVKKIRFHTRFPIGIPERVDDSFLRMLKMSKAQVVFVIHVNHARELDSDVLTRLKEIQKLGIPVLNQAVLLRGVNDDFLTLKTLFQTLTQHGILPYYLHQLDQVQRAAHFEVDEEKGLMLIEQLRAVLPGYAVPQYVREIAGMPSKTVITSQTLYHSRKINS